MLCLGPKKSLLSPRLELMAQGIAYQCSKVECEDHSLSRRPNSWLEIYSCVVIYNRKAFYTIYQRCGDILIKIFRQRNKYFVPSWWRTSGQHACLPSNSPDPRSNPDEVDSIYYLNCLNTTNINALTKKLIVRQWWN